MFGSRDESLNFEESFLVCHGTNPKLLAYKSRFPAAMRPHLNILSIGGKYSPV